MIKKARILIILPLMASLTACAVIDRLGGDQGPEETPVKITAVRVTPAEIKEIRQELTYPGQAHVSQQIPVVSKIAGKVEEVFFQTGDSVEAGDLLFTMDAADIQNNIKSLEAQLTAADTNVRSAETGVQLAGGSAMQSQILQASGGVDQADTGIRQAERSVEQARLAVELAEINLAQATLTVTQRELTVEQAHMAYNDAQRNLEDIFQLYEVGGVPQSQYDQAESARDNARIAYDQAVSALEQTLSIITQSQTSLEQAENGYNTALISQEQANRSYDQALESYNIATGAAPGENLRRAGDGLAQAIAQKNSVAVNLETAVERLEDTYITAPISGVISARNIEPQTMLGASSVPFVIVRTDIIEVRVHVTEAIINNLSLGQTFPVMINAADENPFPGEIVTLSPVAGEMTSTFEVRLAINNHDNRIKPGMYAEVRFARAQNPNALVVPRGAVLTEREARYVFVAEDGHARKAEVITGIDNGEEIEIISGIIAGDLVITRGHTFVTDGGLIYVDREGGAEN